LQFAVMKPLSRKSKRAVAVSGRLRFNKRRHTEKHSRTSYQAFGRLSLSRTGPKRVATSTYASRLLGLPLIHAAPPFRGTDCTIRRAFIRACLCIASCSIVSGSCGTAHRNRSSTSNSSAAIRGIA
jgi:hypothetical protein